MGKSCFSRKLFGHLIAHLFTPHPPCLNGTKGGLLHSSRYSESAAMSKRTPLLLLLLLLAPSSILALCPGSVENDVPLLMPDGNFTCARMWAGADGECSACGDQVRFTYTTPSQIRHFGGRVVFTYSLRVETVYVAKFR